MLEAGVRSRIRVGRHSFRQVPHEFSDAVENWARGHGGHATLKWLPDPMNVFAVILKYKVGDPRVKTGDEGETILLHEWWTAEQWVKRKPDMARKRRQHGILKYGGYYSYELDELGVEGVIKILDRGNILSGRGEFRSAEHAGTVLRERNRKLSEAREKENREGARDIALDRRRQILKIPFLPVGISFNK